MRILFLLIGVLYIQISFGQTTYFPIGDESSILYDKLEAKSGKINPTLHSAMKSYSRQEAISLVAEYQEYKQMKFNQAPSPVMDYNVANALNKNGEWVRPEDLFDGNIRSKKPILKYFYKTQANLYHYADPDFYIVVNPVLYLQAGKSNHNNKLGYINYRGAEIRARIFDKVGIYTFVAEQQEVGPNFFQSFANQWDAFPGNDFYSYKNGTYDGLRARGYIDFPIYKKYVTATFGYDNNFIGEGYRSILLGNNGAASTFIKLKSKYGNWQYQTLFMELMQDYYNSLDKVRPKKYAAIHYLSRNIGKHLQVGFYESTIFNTTNKVKGNYFIPIPLFQTATQSMTDDHKSRIGLNAKYIPRKNLAFYGQFLVDRLDFSFWNEGGWKNQWASQIGFKLFDIAKINNLDFQAEWNFVRPFTYSANDGITNFTHFNQPLAHPMESGFSELILQASFQPMSKLKISGQVIAMNKNPNRTNNVGLSVFENSDNRIAEDSFHVGIKDFDNASQYFLNLNATYELRPNLYFDAGLNYLNNSLTKYSFPYAGMRLNIGRRQYDFWR